MEIETLAPGARMNAADEIIGPALTRGLGNHAAILSGETSLTYAALDAAVNRNGNALRGAGVAVGERVMFLMDDSPALIAGYLGAIRIGAVAVALNVRLAAKDLLFVLADSGCRALYVDAAFLPLYQEIADQLDSPPLLIVAGDEGWEGLSLEAFLAGRSDALASRPMAPDDIAFWIYSSGTTGRPKAAMHRHRDVLIGDRHLREHLGVGPGDRVLTTSKIFFAFALGHSLIGALRCGATVIVFQGWPDAAAVARVVDRQRPSVVFSVPTMYHKLLQDGAAGGEAFRAVRHYVSAGEKLPETLFARWQETTGQAILEGLGTSETIFLFLANTPGSVHSGSCGRKMPWVETRLLDDRGEAIDLPNTPGLLALRMGSVFCGYWNQPELSQTALRDGWYHPGDMFSYDEAGRWYHHGRADEMLKISGQWVSPSEIEGCALKVPEISDAAVVGFANADGLVRLALFAVPKAPDGNQDRLAATLIETLKANLSIYKCPRTVNFLEQLPRTATGKVQKFKLQQMLKAPLQPAA